MYDDLVYTLCHKYLKDYHDIQETYNLILYKLDTKLDTFRNESDIKTFIYAIARNTCISKIRSRARHYTRFKYFEDMSLFDVAEKAADTNPVDTLYERIPELPTTYREILLERLKGASYTELEDVFEIKRGTVRSRLSKAKTLLRKSYELQPMS